MTELPKPEPTVMFEEALRMPLPRIYANGFVNGYSPSDITTVFQCNGSPNLLLTLSYTTAKTLMVELSNLVKQIEEESSMTVLTVSEIAERQNKQKGVKSNK